MLDCNNAVKQIQAGNCIFIAKTIGPHSNVTVFAVRQADIWYVVGYSKPRKKIDLEITGEKKDRILARLPPAVLAAEVVTTIPRSTRPPSIPIDTPVNLPDMLVRPCIVGWKPVIGNPPREEKAENDGVIPPARPWNRTTRNQKIVRFLMQRDGDKCVYCQAEMHLPVYKKEPVATLDHLVPRSKGGTDDITNLVLACRTCNQMKADTLPDEFMRRIWGQFLERCPHKIRI